MKSKNTQDAISSPESDVGNTLCSSRCGLTIDMFGLAAPPVKTTAMPAQKPRNSESATYGRIYSGSQESVILQRSLESKLQQQLPVDGWMTSFMIWKRKNTPALRQYCQLYVSVRHMTAQGYGLWRSPSAQDHRNRGGVASTRRRMKIGKQIMLSMQVKVLLDGSSERTGERGQLNPTFVCWLMGIPKAWESSMQRGMQSIRKSRRRSLKQPGDSK